MDDDFIPLLNLAFSYLKFRPRTIKETREHLYKKVKTIHWSHEAVDKVIDHLIELKFLDDRAFIDFLVRSRTATKVKGIYAIKQELYCFGVDRELVEEYFSNNTINEETLAEKALIKIWPRIQSLPKQKRFEKAISHLHRRGFNFDISKKSIEHLGNKE